jgi:hypothetical protein
MRGGLWGKMGLGISDSSHRSSPGAERVDALSAPFSMDKDILICLQALEWIRLEPHLPSDVWERLTEDDRGMPMLEGRIVPDDATYQRILEIARTHCPEIVKHIEQERQKCLVEVG